MSWLRLQGFLPWLRLQGLRWGLAQHYSHGAPDGQCLARQRRAGCYIGISTTWSSQSSTPGLKPAPESPTLITIFWSIGISPPWVSFLISELRSLS